MSWWGRLARRGAGFRGGDVTGEGDVYVPLCPPSSRI